MFNGQAFWKALIESASKITEINLLMNKFLDRDKRRRIEIFKYDVIASSKS